MRLAAGPMIAYLVGDSHGNSAPFAGDSYLTAVSKLYARDFGPQYQIPIDPNLMKCFYPEPNEMLLSRT